MEIIYKSGFWIYDKILFETYAVFFDGYDYKISNKKIEYKYHGKYERFADRYELLDDGNIKIKYNGKEAIFMKVEN